jgi:hypothetical protein
VLQDRGLIGKADIRYLLRRGNLLDSERTDEIIDAEIEDIVEPVEVLTDPVAPTPLDNEGSPS